MAKVLHDVHCPGQPDKEECASCTRRKLRITGHFREQWVQDERTGESLKTFYVTPPCMDNRYLVKQEVRVGKVVLTGGAIDGNMRMSIHEKMVTAKHDG